MAAVNALPALADLALEISILPFILSAWTGNWCLSALVVIFWEICIREGFGVDSPFPYALPQDEFDGRRYINAIDLFVIIGYAFLGKFVVIITGLPIMLNLTSILPQRLMNSKPGCKEPRESPIMYFMSLIFILFLTLGSYVTYKVLLNNNENLVAVIWINVFPFAALILGFLLYYFWPYLYDKAKSSFKSSSSTIPKTKQEKQNRRRR